MQLVWGFRGEAKDFARIGTKTYVYYLGLLVRKWTAV